MGLETAPNKSNKPTLQKEGCNGSLKTSGGPGCLETPKPATFQAQPAEISHEPEGHRTY